MQPKLVAAGHKKVRYSSYRGGINEVPARIINRDIKSESTNQKWLTDITEFFIAAGGTISNLMTWNPYAPNEIEEAKWK